MNLKGQKKMIDAYTKEYIRLINSVALTSADRIRIADNLIKGACERSLFTKKRAAAAGIAVVLAAGFFIPYMMNKTK